MSSILLGIYEKALAGHPSTSDEWSAFFSEARHLGFGFVDLSIDETPERLARLEWSPQRRHEVRDAASDAGLMIGGVCLSAHRLIGPGSADPAVRQRARDVMAEGIRFCHDLSIPVLQVAGYYCYYEDQTTNAEAWYVEMLEEAVILAAQLGVILGIENVDGTDVTSIRKVMEFVSQINSPYLQAYPDLGNIAEQGLDPAVELTAGAGHMVALHAKDVRHGEPRRVDMGTGIVDWDRSLRVLYEQDWAGRLMIEMWNDDSPESAARCLAARAYLTAKLRDAGFAIA